MSSSPPPFHVFTSIPTTFRGLPLTVSNPTSQTTRGPSTRALQPLASIAQSHAPATDSNASAAVAKWVQNTQLNQSSGTRGSSSINAHQEARMSAYEDKENHAPLPPAREILCSQSQVCEGNLTTVDARLQVLRWQVTQHDGGASGDNELVGEYESGDAMPMTDHLNIVGFLGLDADVEMVAAPVEDEEEDGSSAGSSNGDDDELEDEDDGVSSIVPQAWLECDEKTVTARFRSRLQFTTPVPRPEEL
ncbi:hypothetical protein K438DRAFT_1746901 [Mycena galopus ATCC 62051]|nr:hypothetical protein K438DRAFT_1746901 [Mycena galopus ATCC 62051]